MRRRRISLSIASVVISTVVGVAVWNPHGTTVADVEAANVFGGIDCSYFGDTDCWSPGQGCNDTPALDTVDPDEGWYSTVSSPIPCGGGCGEKDTLYTLCGG
jgi:hypothetical protein